MQKNVSPMYHYNQDKKQNDQHGYESQNRHGLRLLRKYIYLVSVITKLSLCFPAAFPMHPERQLQTVFQNIIQLIHIQRFRDMSIHACIFGQLYIFCKSIGSHGNNRQFSLFTRKAPDCCSCLITIHDRHLDIHKNKIIQSFRRSFHFFNCDFPIFCCFHFCPCHLQNFNTNFSVQLIILNQQNPFSCIICF